MGIKVLKGRNVKVEVATAFSAAKAVTGVTKANPGVATSAAHGFVSGQVGYFDVSAGMVELDGQAATADSTTANTFDLTDINTTNYTTFTAGNFVPVQTWATLANSTKVDIAGGEASKMDVTTLLDTLRQEENGMLAAQSVSIDLLAEQVSNAAAKALRTAARDGSYVLVRVTYPNGSRRIFRGQPSLPGESTSIDQVVSGSLSITVKGFVVATDI